MSKPNIHTLTGDGAFGLVHELCVKPLLEETAGNVIGLVEHDWSLPNRVKTDGRIIPNSLEQLISEGAAGVKYPGATATADELAYAMEATDSPEPKTGLGKGRSPNAAVRGVSGLDASIVRPPAKSAALVKPLETHWNKNTDVEIVTLIEGRKANTEVAYAPQDGEIHVSFNGKELFGASETAFNLSKGSPLTVTHVDIEKAESLIRRTFDAALAKGADVTLTSKNTVLTSIDAPIVKRAQAIFDAEYKEKFAAQGLKLNSGLVDDAFAYLLASEWNHGKPLIMLCPDDSYGAQIKAVLEQVKQKGLHYDHTKHPIAVARLSNGYGDEYGGIHLKPETDGRLAIKDAAGKETIKELKKDSMWLISSHDVKAAETYANRMIEYAKSNAIAGKKIEKLYFGFDANSPAEAPLAKLIDGVIEKRKEELAQSHISAEIHAPEKIAADVLTNPSDKGVLLALNNLWGDIMADLFPALANNKASYDSILISDKGFLVETGAGGTAGGLLGSAPGKPKSGMLYNGKMPLNPIAILSGYAHAIRYKGNTEQLRYADQLEEAIDRTLKAGYVTGDLVNQAGEHQLRSEFVDQGVTPKAVDARVFVQAVKANLLELQGKSAEAERAQHELEEMEKRHDFANPTLPNAEEQEAILKYMTFAPESIPTPTVSGPQKFKQTGSQRAAG